MTANFGSFGGGGDLADSISFIKAEKTRFGSTGVEISSGSPFVTIGSRKAAKLGTGGGFRLGETGLGTVIWLAILSFASWITVKRLISRAVNVLQPDELDQLVTREVAMLISGLL